MAKTKKTAARRVASRKDPSRKAPVRKAAKAVKRVVTKAALPQPRTLTPYLAVSDAAGAIAWYPNADKLKTPSWSRVVGSAADDVDSCPAKT